MVVLFLLALPFVFYVSNSKAPRDHNVVDRAVVWLSAPVQWLTVGVLDGVSNAWRRYIYLVDVQKQNEALRAEVAALQNAVQRRDEYRLENERLRVLVDLHRRAPEARVVFAHVVATSPTPLFRSVRVDRGTGDGVHLGAAVVGPEGLVGRVAAVSGGWSDVMLLVDANNSVDVIVQRTRAHARVRGHGGDHDLGINVEHLGRTEDVEPGDVLITSGTGSVFPKGLRVGTIVSVERGRFGLYQEAAAEPSVDFGRIEEVMILPRGWPADASFELHPAERTGDVAAPDAGAGIELERAEDVEAVAAPDAAAAPEAEPRPAAAPGAGPRAAAPGRASGPRPVEDAPGPALGPAVGPRPVEDTPGAGPESAAPGPASGPRPVEGASGTMAPEPGAPR